MVGGREVELRARAVVGADGATSAIARGLRAGRRPAAARRAVAIRAYADGIDVLDHRVEFYFDKRFLPGYAWVFPLGPERANVGVVIRADRYRESGASLQDLLGEFLASAALRGRLRPGHRIRDASAWQLPTAGWPLPRNAFAGAVLAGDAASLVDPLTGEGIHGALVSGRMAARAIAEALRDTTGPARDLSAYDRMCDEALGPLVRRSARAQAWIGRGRWWVELLFSMAAAAPRQTEAVLNRLSSDFVVRVDG